jgi:hypothetical protein
LAPDRFVYRCRQALGSLRTHGTSCAPGERGAREAGRSRLVGYGAGRGRRECRTLPSRVCGTATGSRPSIQSRIASSSCRRAASILGISEGGASVRICVSLQFSDRRFHGLDSLGERFVRMGRINLHIQPPAFDSPLGIVIVSSQAGPYFPWFQGTGELAPAHAGFDNGRPLSTPTATPALWSSAAGGMPSRRAEALRSALFRPGSYARWCPGRAWTCPRPATADPRRT